MMDPNWRSLPEIRNDKLLFMDTSGYPLPGKIVPCLLCTKPFLMHKYVGNPDQICGECRETYEECAIVRCANLMCGNVVICRLKPKVLDNGFVIKPRAVLHTSACNCCQPGLRESTIVEITEWERLVRPKKAVIIVPESTIGSAV